MRVCDRHPRTQARAKVILADTDERYDLCDQCMYQIKEWIGDNTKEQIEEKPKRRFFKNSA